MKKNMQTSQQRLQILLQQLFRADNADLDFGIYRIINYRRDQIQNFIDKKLPAIVDDARWLFLLDANSEAKSTHQDVESLGQQISETLGDDVLDADGNLINEMYKRTPLVRQYLEMRERLGIPITIPIPARRCNLQMATTSTRSFHATTKTATSFHAGGTTPKPNDTPSHTTAKRYSSTGQTGTNTTSRVANVSPLIVSNLRHHGYL